VFAVATDRESGPNIDIHTVDSTHFVLVYSGGSKTPYGQIRSYLVTGTTISLVDSAVLITAPIEYPDMILLQSGWIMITYRNSSGYNAIQVFQIDPSYNVESISSATAYTAYTNNQNSFIEINDTHYLLAFTNPASSDGYVRTISSSGIGSLTPQIYVDGSWEEVVGMQIYVDGSWEDVTDTQLYQNSVWRDT